MRDWKTVRLGDVCEIVNGFAFDSKLFNTDKKGIPLIRIRDVIRGFSETYTTENADSRFLVKVGDLLIGMDGEFNCSLWKSEDSFLNQRVCKIVPNLELINKDYVYYGLKGKLKEIEDKTSFVTVKHISSKQIENIVLKYPPLKTQQQIVVQLDKCTALIAKQKQILEKYDTLIKSRFIEMFGDPVQNPMNWEVSELGDQCTEVRYGTSKPAVENGKYPYLRMNNITYDGHLDLSNLKHIDIDDEELPKCSVRKGDVLFNRTNSIDLCGKTCLFNLDDVMVIAGYIIRVRLNEKLNPQYVTTFFNTKTIKKLLRKMAKGAVNQANINAQEMQAIRIPLPPIDLQNDFAAFVHQIDKSKFEYTYTGVAA